MGVKTIKYRKINTQLGYSFFPFKGDVSMTFISTYGPHHKGVTELSKLFFTACMEELKKTIEGGDIHYGYSCQI